MYHIVICDDDTLFIDHMKCLLLRAGLKPETCKFYSYLSANEFEADFQNFYTIDLLILDIQLPDVNGTVFAKSFREKFPSSTLVFCSGKQSPTPESFESEPYRYLLKAWTDAHMVEKLTPVIAHCIGRNCRRNDQHGDNYPQCILFQADLISLML